MWLKKEKKEEYVDIGSRSDGWVYAGGEVAWLFFTSVLMILLLLNLSGIVCIIVMKSKTC